MSVIEPQRNHAGSFWYKPQVRGWPLQTMNYSIVLRIPRGQRWIPQGRKDHLPAQGLRGAVVRVGGTSVLGGSLALPSSCPTLLSSVGLSYGAHTKNHCWLLLRLHTYTTPVSSLITAEQESKKTKANIENGPHRKMAFSNN